MAIQCFTEFLGSLLYKICRGDELAETFGRLPNSLVIDILSRLPADTLVRCQSDCRGLISSSYFTNLHVSRAKTMVILTDFWGLTKQERQLYVTCENLNKKDNFNKLYLRSGLMINEGEHSPSLLFSCQGILLFACSMSPLSTYCVLNPITQEEVIVKHTLQPGMLCALYFHPLAKKFQLLYAQQLGVNSWHYLVYVFKTQTWRKTRSLSSTFNFLPGGSPAVVNYALHWITLIDLDKQDAYTPLCANGIVVFKMDTEEFFTMPHPGRVCNNNKVHKTMTLLVKEDCLCLCQLRVPGYHVDIWILEDYEMRAWNKRYRVNLFDKRIFPSVLLSPIDVYSWITLFYIQDGELAFHLVLSGLYLYNLDHKTARRVDLPKKLNLVRRKAYVKSLMAIA